MLYRVRPGYTHFPEAAVIRSRPTTWQRFATLTAMLSGTLLAAQNSKPLLTPPSPGQAIQDAAKAAAHAPSQDRPPDRTIDTVYGAEGKVGSLDILTNTQGVNFGPYLKDVLATVRKNWYALIPADSKTKRGKLAIQFAIHKDGSISNLHLDSASGDVSLDRAAWGAITGSIPFEALPSEFTGPYLLLRFRFYYNPNASDLAAYKPAPAVADSVVHASVLQDVADSNPPKYPKKAVKNKLEGIVRMDAQIDPDGKVKNIYTSEGNLILADAAFHAIRKWRFHPAQMNGKPVEDKVRVKVEFRLDGERVHAQVVSPETNRAAQLSP